MTHYLTNVPRPRHNNITSPRPPKGKSNRHRTFNTHGDEQNEMKKESKYEMHYTLCRLDRQTDRVHTKKVLQ